jgi:hypothetical protein
MHPHQRACIMLACLLLRVTSPAHVCYYNKYSSSFGDHIDFHPYTKFNLSQEGSMNLESMLRLEWQTISSDEQYKRTGMLPPFPCAHMTTHYHAEPYQLLLVNTSTLSGVLGMLLFKYLRGSETCLYILIQVMLSLWLDLERAFCKLNMASLHQLQVQLDVCHTG